MNREQIVKFLINKRGSATVIGGSLGIAAVYALWSRGFLNEPNLLVYAAVFVVFSAIGGAVDYHQSKVAKEP